MRIEELVKVPSGFKFEPTDEELIMHYLLRKVNGMVLPCDGVVTERVVYGENSTPWEIFDDEKDPWVSGRCKNKKTIYVFTRLKRKNKGKKQIERTAGCGTWDGQTAPRAIKNGAGQVIGSRKYFSFEATKLGNENYVKVYGHWGMHEFSVSNGLKAGGGVDYVLCAITRDDSKRISKELIKLVPSVDVVQSNNQAEELEAASRSSHQLLEQEVASRSVVHRPLDLEEVASEYGDPMLLKKDAAPALKVAGGNFSLSQMIEYNGFQFQGSTMIEHNGFWYPGEFQGSTITGYGQMADLGINNLQHLQGEASGIGYLDAISIDELSEPLSWEKQWLGKRKLLEKAENPCRKKLSGNHIRYFR